MAYTYGWKPSLPDLRNEVADATGLGIAIRVDPRGEMPPVYDQGALGSCTANAVAGAIHYDAILKDQEFGVPSRLFIYYQERVLEGTIPVDVGAMGHDGFRVAHRWGTPPEDVWPYIPKKFAEHPTQQAYDSALEHILPRRYKHPVPDLTTFKQILSNKQTIAFGFTVYESFESWDVARTGIVPNPGVDEKRIGGHEVLLVGYLDDEPQYGLCRNSWGTGWGLEGYFLMPWSYILSRLAGDFRTIHRPSPSA